MDLNESKLTEPYLRLLRPCPHCGRRADIEVDNMPKSQCGLGSHGTLWWAHAWCHTCKIRMRDSRGDTGHSVLTSAVIAWNKFVDEKLKQKGAEK